MSINLSAAQNNFLERYSQFDYLVCTAYVPPFLFFQPYIQYTVSTLVQLQLVKTHINPLKEFLCGCITCLFCLLKVKIGKKYLYKLQNTYKNSMYNNTQSHAITTSSKYQTADQLEDRLYSNNNPWSPSIIWSPSTIKICWRVTRRCFLDF